MINPFTEVIISNDSDLAALFEFQVKIQLPNSTTTQRAGALTLLTTVESFIIVCHLAVDCGFKKFLPSPNMGDNSNHWASD